MKHYFLLASILLIACSKNNDTPSGEEQIAGGIVQKTETAGGITFRSFAKENQTQFKESL